MRFCCWAVVSSFRDSGRALCRQRYLRQFRTALNDRSFELLQPILAPDLRIDDMPAGLSRDGLKAGLPALQGKIVDWQILSLAPPV